MLKRLLNSHINRSKSKSEIYSGNEYGQRDMSSNEHETNSMKNYIEKSQDMNYIVVELNSKKTY